MDGMKKMQLFMVRRKGGQINLGDLQDSGAPEKMLRDI